jgi:ABC-type transport system involved in cytochrome c biogenesis permease subunit
MPSRQPSAPQDRTAAAPATAWLWGLIAVNGAGIAALTVMNFLPLFQARGAQPEDKAVKVPELNVADWRSAPVQDQGRYKPFETAAQEVLRRVHGRIRLQGKDAVAVVLMWMFENDAGKPRSASSWDKVPFLLCEHEGLRNLVYRLRDDGTLSDGPLAEGQEVHGRYLAPADLRPFRNRFHALRENNREKYREVIGPVERQAQEAIERLGVYESIRQGPIVSKDTKPADPFAFVALDKVKGSPWFSVAEVRFALNDPEVWQNVLMKDRVTNAPQNYISPEHRKALEEFQAEVKAGAPTKAMQELRTALRERAEGQKRRFLAARTAGDRDAASQVLHEILLPLVSEDREQLRHDLGAPLENLAKDLEQLGKAGGRPEAEVAGDLGQLTDRAGARLIAAIEKELPTQRGYDPDDPKFRMLHLTYLETRFPDLYKVATTWQPFPAADATRVVAAYNAVGVAYRSGEPARFAEASQAFFRTVKEVSEKYGHAYPGEDSIADRLGALVTGGALNTPGESLLELERTFNRVQPFMWGWILMLVALVLLALNLGLDSRWLYRGGMLFYAASLLVQLFGFFTRIVISGRPPVSNMYETVIWVAFMSGIFALVLEGIYRRKVISVAGAMVSTISLVLADQLPLALDPKISPLVPVLRSNFWLTIHVLTIVSSYAAGALAWGLGNIALVLLLFASNKRETIKTLSNYTYRALQIAVLLLAAGTFLGGWWAAYSWGRFWGWDPKETGALIALLCYVIPLHMRYIGWIKDFGLAVAAILCFAAIMMSWYGINFWIPAGLHSYGFGGGGVGWVFWASLINIEWVLVARLLYIRPMRVPAASEMSLLQADAPSTTEGSLDLGSKSEHVKV